MILSVFSMFMGIASLYTFVTRGGGTSSSSSPDSDYHMVASIICILTSVRIFPREISVIFMLVGILYCISEVNSNPLGWKIMEDISLSHHLLRMGFSVLSIMFCAVTGPSIKECFVNVIILSILSLIILVFCSYYNIYDVGDLVSRFADVDFSSLMERANLHMQYMISKISSPLNKPEFKNL